MITLNFHSSKRREMAHEAMQLVAYDVTMFARYLNKMLKCDRDVNCPVEKRENTPKGVVNSTELWFGLPKPNEFIDVSIHRNSTITIKTGDRFFSLLFKLTCLSLSEQFPKVTFVTDENFDEAIRIYGEMVGSISGNACRSLKILEVN